MTVLFEGCDCFAADTRNLVTFITDCCGSKAPVASQEALHVGELDMKDYFFMPASRVVPGSQLDALPLVAAESERIAALARRGATQKSAEAAV